ALLALDGLLRRWPSAIAWVDERRDIWWRNQFVFNLALARLRCAVELDPVFNIQLNSQDVALSGDRETAMSAHWHGQRVRVLHFNGGGRKKYAQWRAEFHSRARTSLSGIPNNCGRSPELPLSGLTGQAPIIQSACDGQL
ncbi:MAG TPA: hypothetical protein VFI76_03085, partial [Terrimicrobiaceae bacterium]|nr:hypothetical protein [Terrimicrobiaceae bacterium]